MQLLNFLKEIRKRSSVFWLCSLAIILLGVSAGDQLELQTHFNARYSAKFTKSSHNISTVLAPKTQAQVTEVKVMPSGNLGLRVKVLTGSAKGKTVWVYYNKKNPRMSLHSSEDGTGAEVGSAETENARSVNTKKNVAGLEEPTLDDKNETQQDEDFRFIIGSVNQANRDVQRIGAKAKGSEDCDTSAPAATRLQSAANATLMAPRNTLNTKKSIPTCRTANGYDACTYNGDSAPTVFKVFNAGPNRVVSGGSFDRRREWSFYSPNFATQDLGFYVEDYNGSDFSNSQRSYVMLFPRKTLSSVQVSGNDKIVTLPTGETVTFNQRTNEIVSGAFVEAGKLGSSSSAPVVKYQGQGVMVRADSVGVNEPKQARLATITKGSQTCKVPSSELWQQGNSSQLNFKFPSDSQFNSYLKARCGFGI